MFESVAPTLAYDNAIMKDGSIPTADTKAVKIPVLVLNGGNSPAFMHNAADSLAKADRRTLQGQSHDVKPEILAPVLEEFFKHE